MRVAYISGPYRARTKLGVIINIIRAWLVARRYWKKGFVVICPHSNTALMDGAVDDEKFLEGDLKILESVDVIVMMKRYRQSKGAVKEMLRAQELKKEIIFDYK